jgi:hypothetical protein
MLVLLRRAPEMDESELQQPYRALTGRATRALGVRLGKARSLHEEHSRGEQDYLRRNATFPRRIPTGAAADPKTHVAKSEPEYDAAMLA